MNLEKYINLIGNSYKGYFNYLISEFTNLSWSNYFYGLLAISLIVWLLEIIFPWRKNQPVFRKDFWLDLGYLFFNFFILNLILLIALSNVTEQLFNDFLAVFNLQLVNINLFQLSDLPKPIKSGAMTRLPALTNIGIICL